MSFCFYDVFCFPNGFVDKHTTVPNFNLVNQPSLDKILKAKVFVLNDGQLRVAHLILGYNPLPSSFQAPKCVIKAKDPCLHLVNVVVPGFLNPSLGPQGLLKAEALHQYKAEDEATPSQPAIKEEEEEKKGVVEVLDFEVFNLAQSPEAPTGDFNHLPLAQVSQTQGDSSIPEAMGCKPKTRLLDLLESHAGGNVLERVVQPKPATLPFT